MTSPEHNYDLRRILYSVREDSNPARRGMSNAIGEARLQQIAILPDVIGFGFVRIPSQLDLRCRDTRFVNRHVISTNVVYYLFDLDRHKNSISRMTHP